MAQLNFNANNVQPDQGIAPVPAGWYNVVIDESEMKPTKDGSGSYLALRLNIIEGFAAGRKIFTRLNLANQNPTAVEIAQKQLSAICHATGVMQVNDSQQLHNIPFQVRVKVRAANGDYDESNDVTTYCAQNSNPIAAAPIKTGGQGAPGGFNNVAPQGQVGPWGNNAAPQNTQQGFAGQNTQQGAQSGQGAWGGQQQQTQQQQNVQQGGAWGGNQQIQQSNTQPQQEQGNWVGQQDPNQQQTNAPQNTQHGGQGAQGGNWGNSQQPWDNGGQQVQQPQQNVQQGGQPDWANANPNQQQQTQQQQNVQQAQNEAPIVGNANHHNIPDGQSAQQQTPPWAQ